jgi:predicted TIM-barrel fold metal-dependent hydrolase
MTIDAHAHLPADHSDVAAVFDDLDLKVINVCVAAGDMGGLTAQRQWYRGLAERRGDRFAWITSFSLVGFGTPDWADRAIAQIDGDLAGVGLAVGCKVWKNVGMELRDPASGGFVFVDDPRFTPIFEHLAARGCPALMHIGEPLACWRALDPASPHYGYYKSCPQWHWFGRTDVPSHEQLMAARDRVLERHPGLHVIGAHYGSHEYDVGEVARRFDRYANFTVDTSARMGDIAMQTRHDREAVRRFFIRYADRLLWGVDWVFSQPASAMSADQRHGAAEALRRTYDTERRFFTTDEQLTIAGQPVRGLALPADVAHKLMLGNARRIYGV